MMSPALYQEEEEEEEEEYDWYVYAIYQISLSFLSIPILLVTSKHYANCLHWSTITYVVGCNK